MVLPTNGWSFSLWRSAIITPENRMEPNLPVAVQAINSNIRRREASIGSACYNASGMIPLIEQHRPQIAELCRACYCVKRLESFGPAASEAELFDELAKQWLNFRHEYERSDYR